MASNGDLLPTRTEAHEGAAVVAAEKAHEGGEAHTGVLRESCRE